MQVYKVSHNRDEYYFSKDVAQNRVKELEKYVYWANDCVVSMEEVRADLDVYIEIIKNFDFTYDQSDDPFVFRENSDAMENIRKLEYFLIFDCAETVHKTLVTLWNASVDERIINPDIAKNYHRKFIAWRNQL